jgi:hypothetical protein
LGPFTQFSSPLLAGRRRLRFGEFAECFVDSASRDQQRLISDHIDQTPVVDAVMP